MKERLEKEAIMLYNKCIKKEGKIKMFEKLESVEKH